jgi:hypothetical protein
MSPMDLTSCEDLKLLSELSRFFCRVRRLKMYFFAVSMKVIHQEITTCIGDSYRFDIAL